ncbi:MAG: D-alanine--D-alanine ligase [Hallerella porci]|uniref:D-alanine--D-alanine ligase n=1 Tax=Hallerella porci TaxID=1945871 RepID=A0ABX5LNT0_9BACT|nr:D-alanine--D-alanine ligase [Hallerella porci]MDY3921218.1 D-alanine--D-alanine ligase [Hallerella porci]PWL04069.1 D-alanine--D-alanine ligase [Hallerella porci]
MSRLRVLVFMGGYSTEHDVSVTSGTGVIRAMDAEKYNIHPVLIQKDGTWIWSSRELSPYQKNNFSENYFYALEGPSACSEKNPPLSALPSADIAFLALHGKWGEDGHVQAMLENWGIPYTGCGLLASALAMDKVLCKAAYLSAGIATPPYQVLYRDDFKGDDLVAAADKLGFPLVIKDPVGGSSIGMGIAKNMDEAGEIVNRLFKNSARLLCEKFIRGGEASCGYMEGLEKPLPPTEMRMTTREYFDYEAKYNGECREVTPAEFPQELTERIQQLSKKAHLAIGGAGYSRTDVRIDADGKLWALETNTLPGMTPTSILPAEAAAIGISYSELIDRIIETSLKIKR